MYVVRYNSELNFAEITKGLSPEYIDNILQNPDFLFKWESSNRFCEVLKPFAPFITVFQIMENCKIAIMTKTSFSLS